MSGAPRGRDSELASLENSQRLVRYNSPDMSGVHRTVRCDNGSTATSAPTVTCRRIKCALERRSQARASWRTGHATVHVWCATGHPGGPGSQSSNDRNPNGRVTWLSHRTCPVHHTTDSLHQTASLVVGAINTPNHPTFKASKFSHFYTLQEL